MIFRLIMWGTYLVKLMPTLNLNGMFGMLLIVVSTGDDWFVTEETQEVKRATHDLRKHNSQHYDPAS
jgi:hypothetical protein